MNHTGGESFCDELFLIEGVTQFTGACFCNKPHVGCQVRVDTAVILSFNKLNIDHIRFIK